jgi:outer membrane protein assembly factor BamB
MGHSYTEVTVGLPAIYWVDITGQRRGDVDIQPRDSLLLLSLWLSWLCGYWLCGRKHLLLQRHRATGECISLVFDATIKFDALLNETQKFKFDTQIRNPFQLWQFLAKGAVFSTPCFTPDRQRVLCGAHDGYVYCLETAGGSLVWSFQTSGRVYASPFAFESRSALGREQVLVGVASTDGMLWILDERDGCKIASLSLPGELFSSPVVWERTLLVGCRNDMVYCIDLTNPPNKEELEGHAHMETLPGTGDA